MYETNEFKYVALLNRTVPAGRLMNVMGHGANALQRQLREREEPLFARYQDADGGELGEISVWPYIVLEASSSAKIRAAKGRLAELALPCIAMSSSMFAASNEAQLAATRACCEADLEYYALFTFGPAQTLNEVFKRFSLFKNFRAPETVRTAEVPL